MPVRLIDSLATTRPLADIFSDESLLGALLEFEVALARAEAKLGIIPADAAGQIARASQVKSFDAGALADATFRAGTPGIPIVKALTERVRGADPAAAGYVHWGATSQDVADTALVLLLKRAQAILQSDLIRLEHALADLATQHRDTVMLGRTLMQAAPPITFGLKAAGWFAAVQRSHVRLDVSFQEALILQFGGATGTLAALGEQGPLVGRAIADFLEIGCPEAPWHTHRDRLASLLCSCGVLCGSLGKMARDIVLLMQSETGEASEPSGEGRGGSSTMPHKRNPIACSLTLAAANRVPGLVSSFLTCMVQEHERGVGGWQAEWPIVSGVIQGTGVALASMAEVAEGLSIDKQRMRANIDATNGVIFAEKAMILLGSKVGRDSAHKLLEEATRRSVAERRPLAEVLARLPEVTRHLDNKTLDELTMPEHYLGSSKHFADRQIASGKKKSRTKE